MITHSIEYVGYGTEQSPKLTLVVDGVHDVGRILNTLARGNVEHSSEAREAATELRRTPVGQYTMKYLEGHGGPVLGHDPNTRCDDCGRGRYIDEEWGSLPMNCPDCSYGQLYPIEQREEE